MSLAKSMLLLSIHPKHVDSILAGTKRVELRRQQPSVRDGHALIYATSPRMELVATFRVASVKRLPLVLLWQSVRDVAGVSRREFNDYFSGLASGVAIQIADVAKFQRPVPLDELRAAWRGFHPPQGFRYLSVTEMGRLLQMRIAA